MDKNIRYAIKHGYPVVKIGLTYDEAKQAMAELETVSKLHNAEFEMVNLICNLIYHAIQGLEA